MTPKLMISANATRIMELAHSMDTAASRGEWRRAEDYALRIDKLVQECANLCDEQDKEN